MGNRSNKQSSRSSGSFFKSRGGKNKKPRPFPVITPESFLPGSHAAAGYYEGFSPTGGNQSPGMMPESFQPSSAAPPIAYPNMNSTPAMSREASHYDPKYGSNPRRCCSGVCHPVIHIIRSDSCSSASTCSTISLCSRKRHRSCSCSRQCDTSPQQKQAVILLPMQYQQQSPAITGSTSIPQIMPAGKPQQYIAGPITYVRAMPQSAMSPSTTSVHSLPQTDLKYGRRPFDWYPNDGIDQIIKEDITIGRRGETYIA